jgi:hypothetical protein
LEYLNELKPDKNLVAFMAGYKTDSNANRQTNSWNPQAALQALFPMEQKWTIPKKQKTFRKPPVQTQCTDTAVFPSHGTHFNQQPPQPQPQIPKQKQWHQPYMSPHPNQPKATSPTTKLVPPPNAFLLLPHLFQCTLFRLIQRDIILYNLEESLIIPF